MSTTTTGVRELGVDDVDAIVELATLCEIAETGEPDPELVDWISGGSKLPQFRAFGIDGEGGLAAFSFVECVEGHAALETEVRVRPGLDRDLGLPVLAAARRAAADYDASLPVHLMANAGAEPHRRWLEAQGAQEVRHFWRMAIDLDDAPAPAVPPAPAGVVVRVARDDEDELRDIFRITDTAFAEHFGHTDNRSYDRWIENWRVRRGFDLSLWWVAELDGVPIAVLLGMTFTGDDGVTTGHVGTLGTLAEARGRGIGTLLLRTSFAEFHRRGYRRVTLGVDSENGTGAVRLYESVGMRAVADWALYELPPL